jgi:hypothetical protein
VRKPKAKPNSERHKRLIETAKKVGASDDPEEFKQSFKTVAPKKRR